MKYNLLKDQKGTTLLEVIVTIMVLTVSLSILATGFYTVYNFIAEGNAFQKSLDKQMIALSGEEVEGVQLENKRDELFTMKSDGKLYTFSEDTTKSIDINNDAFTLKGMSRDGLYLSTVERDLYENYKKMFVIYNGFSNEEKKKIAKDLGLGGQMWLTNDHFLQYLFQISYGKSWPELPKEVLPDKHKETTFHIRICANGAQGVVLNENTDLIIFATTSNVATGQWHAAPTLIYDYGDGTDFKTGTGWYIHPNGRSVNTMLQGTDWKTFRVNNLLPQTNGWTKLEK